MSVPTAIRGQSRAPQVPPVPPGPSRRRGASAAIAARPLPEAAPAAGGAAFPAPVEPGALAHAILAAFDELRRAEARVVLAEARHLFDLRKATGHETLGFSSFGDLAREVLLIPPSTAADRIHLHELLAARPRAKAAFLAGSLTACQALVLRSVLAADNEAFWLEECSRLTVRRLKLRVRELRGTRAPAPTAPEADEDGDMAVVSFEAPPGAVLAWDHAMEMARRVLGWQAPLYCCVEALLAEAAPEAGEKDPGATKPAEAPGRPPRRADAPPPGRADAPPPGPAPPPGVPGFDAAPPPPSGPADPGAVARARRTLALIRRELTDIDDLIESAPGGSPHRSVERVRALQLVERPLRVLTGRLLRDLRDTGLLFRLGFAGLEDFAEARLHLSERTARTLLAEARTFAEHALLEEAFGTGRISLGQALLIARRAPRGCIARYIQRAATVTHRQFHREIRLMERLEDFDRELAARHPGPLPDLGLETALLRALLERGWTGDEITRLLQGRRLLDGGGTQDPAENPVVMRRLEVLLDLVLLTAFDNADELWDDLPPPARQTFVMDGAAAAGGVTDHPGAGARQTFVAADTVAPDPEDVRLGGRSLGRLRPLKTIRFRAPLAIRRHWRAALALARGDNPALPAWAAVIILAARAVEEWERQDPDNRPAGWAILDRDGWLCQAPGCTCRRGLEVHHVLFRSRGGSDRAANKVTLCQAHHRHGVHQGRLRVAGEAPHALRWQIGSLWRTRGERKTPAPGVGPGRPG